jgi:hypothetical protein
LLISSLFETLFNKVFTLCVNSGKVSGHTQAVDSPPVKANASMEIVVLKTPANSIDNHLKKVVEETKRKKSYQQLIEMAAIRYTDDFAELKTESATLAIGSTRTLHFFGGDEVAKATQNLTAIIDL